MTGSPSTFRRSRGATDGASGDEQGGCVVPRRPCFLRSRSLAHVLESGCDRPHEDCPVGDIAEAMKSDRRRHGDCLDERRCPRLLKCEGRSATRRLAQPRKPQDGQHGSAPSVEVITRRKGGARGVMGRTATGLRGSRGVGRRGPRSRRRAPPRRSELGGDADGERVAADTGEVFAEQVSCSLGVAGGGGADHLDVVAFPVHLLATGSFARGSGDGVEIGDGQPEGRVGVDREAQRRGRPTGIDGLAALGGRTRPPAGLSSPHGRGPRPPARYRSGDHGGCGAGRGVGFMIARLLG